MVAQATDKKTYRLNNLSIGKSEPKNQPSADDVPPMFPDALPPDQSLFDRSSSGRDGALRRSVAERSQATKTNCRDACLGTSAPSCRTVTTQRGAPTSHNFRQRHNPARSQHRRLHFEQRAVTADLVGGGSDDLVNGNHIHALAVEFARVAQPARRAADLMVKIFVGHIARQRRFFAAAVDDHGTAVHGTR